MTKKIIFLILTVAILSALCCLTLFGCGDTLSSGNKQTSTTTHTHSMTYVKAVEVTCLTDGHSA
ncbi:MAG: hypothetical protein IJ735_02115 [Clostridia bacterium]|nr:hypothetical protein [Clostridia bacterium]